MLACPVCRGNFPDDGIRLACPQGCVSLLRTVYNEPHAPLDEYAIGIGRYHRRLPGDASRMTTPLPTIIELPWLSARYPHLELRIVFSGWWPSRGAYMPSGSFKDLEAAAVLSRLSLRPQSTVVLASAGNTAAAFATACTQLQRRCVIVVAEDALPRIYINQPLGDAVTIVTLKGGAAYDDAIALSRRLIDGDRFVLEGGVRNVARRDGMGIALGVVLEADGCMPDVYVQAVGSAAGAIAVLETALKARVRYPEAPLPKLALSQNAPFTPVAQSYRRRSRLLLSDDDTIARYQIEQITAPVLSNMAPPYEMAGGVYDSLRLSGGEVTTVSNQAALACRYEFSAREHVELDGAAAVALASLASFDADVLPQGSRVLLHLTGGREVGNLRQPQIPLSSSVSIETSVARSHPADNELRMQLLGS